jgi:predicted membrane-bound spermidine synthase
MSTYNEVDTILGATYTWNNSIIEYSTTTSRGTLVEMVRRPGWGLSCYMDKTIQSCELDEKKYHQTLVEPILKSEPRTVCILGGGEGATAREILTDPFISQVDMIEWDKDVVELFRTKYRQWPSGAFEDTRLHIEYKDVFDVCEQKRSYDGLVVDLFEPEDMEGDNSIKWLICLIQVASWVKKSISIYGGMKSPFQENISVKKIVAVLEYLGFKNIVIQSVYIPSFMGECYFISGNR